MSFPDCYGPNSGCEDCTPDNLCNECDVNWCDALTALDCTLTVLRECQTAAKSLEDKTKFHELYSSIHALRLDGMKQYKALVYEDPPPYDRSQEEVPDDYLPSNICRRCGTQLMSTINYCGTCERERHK